MQKSPGSGGTMRSGELMVADMKEYVAANDMVSIEKRLNPAVNPSHAGPVPANIGPIPENSPKVSFTKVMIITGNLLIDSTFRENQHVKKAQKVHLAQALRFDRQATVLH